jgi:hypothetical protein
MARRNPAADERPAASESLDQGPEQGPVEPAAEGARRATGKMTKFEAVKQALAGGRDSAREAMPWIKEQFDLDINEPTFNSYKSSIKNKARKEQEPEPQGEGFKGEVDPLEAARAVKELVEKYGAKTVKGLADLFDR